MNVSLFLEIKNEYTEHLVDTLTPFIYEGVNSIYKEAVKISEENNSKNKTLLIFQKLLQSVPNWNQLKIEEEANRIKQLSNTSDYLDDLVKAVVKSNIILLAYSNSISSIIGQTFYNNLTTATFIHRCYTECAKDAHNNPYLFYHDINPMDLKRSQIIIQQNIQSAIIRAVRKILPISMILREYLVNSINIIQEPPKIELVGRPESGSKAVSENKIDPKIEKEVMNIIKSDCNKSDKQKIQAIMNIDRIITSMAPNKVEEMSVKSELIRKKKSDLMQQSDLSAKAKSDHGLPIHLMETEEYDPENKNLHTSDRNILNLNFDAQTTISGSHSKKSASGGTSLSNNPQARINRIEETSERIDPSKVQLIEDYGMQGGNKRFTKKH